MPATRLSLAFALSLLLATGFAAAASDGVAVEGADIDKVNGSITAESGQAYGNLETVNGSIRIEDGAHARDAQTVNGSIKAGDAIEAGDLGTVNGGIFVDHGGNVAKGIETVNGAIGIVATELGGGIETVNGDVTVGIDSHVRGGIKVSKPTSNWMPIKFGNNRKPRIVIGPNAVVDGGLVFEREVTLYVHTSARIGTVTGATPVAFDTPSAPRD